MYDDGFENMWNNDISSVVIDQMNDRSKDKRHKMICKLNILELIDEVMDVRSMTYPDNFFDIAIDKSTIDALLCGN